MSVKFRIDAVRLDTVNGTAIHAFPDDLTVLSGRTAVGKTTLFELIKFGLGGEGQLAPVSQGITDVHIDIRVGDLRLQLARSIEPDRQRVVRVTDLVTRERMPDHTVDGDDPTISQLLLSAMGLESGLRAAARGGRSTSAGNQVTFNDLLKFMYIPQNEMNHDIAWSQESYYTPKRMAVFELLFNLTSAPLLRMRSEINTLRSQIDSATREVETVRQFLADTDQASRFDALVAQSKAQEDEQRAQQELAVLRRGLEEAVDRHSQVLRDMLTEAERSLAEARDMSAELRRQRQDYRTEGDRVALDIGRLERMQTAGLRLAEIEFVVCPRCTQRLDGREVPESVCRVCLQSDIVAGVGTGDQFEADQLRSQLEEIQTQLSVIDREAERVVEAVGHREALVVSLTQEIDNRTSARVTPRLQSYADAVGQLERSRAEQRALEKDLRQWDRAEDLAERAEALSIRRSRLQSDLDTQQSALATRKAALFTELDAEFQATVADFGIPSIESASISPETYLPLLNGQPFSKISLGGGIITATQVAYWMTLITVGARLRDNHVPTFLMLDSPRLALNAEDDIAAQMYRRFETQAAVTPGRLQFIIADNVLPAKIERSFRELVFTYDSPTVPTLEHPGLDRVRTLNSRSEDE